MADQNTFLGYTAEAATFAFREYFRPLVAGAHLLKSAVAPSQPVEQPEKDSLSLEGARAVLRERLAEGRHHEKVLLVSSVVSALASLFALVISLTPALNLDPGIVLAVLVPVSTFTVWVTLRLVRNRDEMVEWKTIRWLMKSVDEETAESVVKQVTGKKPK